MNGNGINIKDLKQFAIEIEKELQHNFHLGDFCNKDEIWLKCVFKLESPIFDILHKSKRKHDEKQICFAVGFNVLHDEKSKHNVRKNLLKSNVIPKLEQSKIDFITHNAKLRVSDSMTMHAIDNNGKTNNINGNVFAYCKVDEVQIGLYDKDMNLLDNSLSFHREFTINKDDKDNDDFKDCLYLTLSKDNVTVENTIQKFDFLGVRF